MPSIEQREKEFVFDREANKPLRAPYFVIDLSAEGEVDPIVFDTFCQEAVPSFHRQSFENSGGPNRLKYIVVQDLLYVFHEMSASHHEFLELMRSRGIDDEVESAGFITKADYQCRIHGSSMTLKATGELSREASDQKQGEIKRSFPQLFAQW